MAEPSLLVSSLREGHPPLSGGVKHKDAFRVVSCEEPRNGDRVDNDASGRKKLSLSYQKEFIVENGGILTKEIRVSILQMVVQEMGYEAVMEAAGSREVNINLDIVAERNPEVIQHIYNIVLTRRSALSQPVGITGRVQAGASQSAKT